MGLDLHYPNDHAPGGTFVLRIVTVAGGEVVIGLPGEETATS